MQNLTPYQELCLPATLKVMCLVRGTDLSLRRDSVTSGLDHFETNGPLTYADLPKADIHCIASKITVTNNS